MNKELLTKFGLDKISEAKLPNATKALETLLTTDTDPNEMTETRVLLNALDVHKLPNKIQEMVISDAVDYIKTVRVQYKKGLPISADSFKWDSLSESNQNYDPNDKISADSFWWGQKETHKKLDESKKIKKSSYHWATENTTI